MVCFKMLLKPLPHCPSKRLYQFLPSPRMFENKFSPILNSTDYYQSFKKNCTNLINGRGKKKHGRVVNRFGSRTGLVQIQTAPRLSVVLYASSFNPLHLLSLSLQWGVYPPRKAWWKSSIVCPGQTRRAMSQ